MPHEEILAHGTADPLADAATQARLATELSFLLGSTRADGHPTAMRDPCRVQGGDRRTHPEKNGHRQENGLTGTRRFHIIKPSLSWFVGMMDDETGTLWPGSRELRATASERERRYGLE